MPTSLMATLKRIAGLAAVVFLLIPAQISLAASLQKPKGYPSRTITMMVPFGTGGGSDEVARALAREFQDIMGVGIQIVNKPGAGGIAALPDFMVAPDDGYTILEHTDGIVTGYAAGKSKVEPGKDVLPICITQVAFSMIFINAHEKRFTDWKSLVAYAKSSGKSLKIATSSGIGSHEHVTSMQVAEGAGIKLDVVPFGDPGQRYSSIIGGHIDLLFDQAGDAMPYVREGKLKPVLMILKKSPEAFKNVPALPDVGLNFDPTFKFRGFWVRAGVPAERRAYLEKACHMAFETKRYQAFNHKTYTDLVRSYYDTKDALDLSRRMIATYQGMFKKLGIKK
jgi:putative tricarboxylic transport membrane protein